MYQMYQLVDQSLADPPAPTHSPDTAQSGHRVPRQPSATTWEAPATNSRQQPPSKKPTETPLKNNHTRRFPQKTSPAVLSPEFAGLIPNWGSFLLFAGARASCCSDAAVLEVPRKIGSCCVSWVPLGDGSKLGWKT